MTLRLLRSWLTMPTIGDCGVTGKTKASASEKEEMIWRNDMARSHQKWRKHTGGKIGKMCSLYVSSPQCIVMTVQVG